MRVSPSMSTLFKLVFSGRKNICWSPMPDRTLMPDMIDDLRIGFDDLLERLALPASDVRLHQLVVEGDVDVGLACERVGGLTRAPEG